MAKTKHTDMMQIKSIAHTKIKDEFIHLHVVLNSKTRNILIILFNILKMNEGRQGTNDKKKP